MSTSTSGPIMGISFMLLAMLCFSTMDALGKELVSRFSVVQVLAARSVCAATMLLAFLAARGHLYRLRTRRPALQLLRGAIAICTMLCFFFAVRGLPLAEATAICFGSPLLMTVLSVPLLGERVGRERWLATVLGFGGVLLITAPGSVHFTVHTVSALASSVTYALLMVTTRFLKEERTESMVGWVILVQAVVASSIAPFHWRPITAMDGLMFAAMALLNLGGFVFLTRAFQSAEVAVVAPFEYAALLVATALGYWIYDEVPAARVYLGGAIIVACGIAVMVFEQRAAQRTRSASSAKVGESAGPRP